MNRIEFGDCRETMRKWKEQGIKAQTCVTSPPYYGLRDYGHDGQIGLEETPEEYIAAMVEVFRCVWDVLKDDGTLWLNIGDSYGSGKQLLGIPWKLAFALQSNGWVLRQDIIWHKPNPMPESVQDRCTKSHEYIFLLSKAEKYFYDAEAIKEASVDPEGSANRYKTPFFAGEKHESGGYSATGATHTKGMKEFDGNRNKRSVWTVTTKPYAGAHFAVFPSDLIEPCILAGAPVGGVVLDPFMGSGTTAQVAQNLGRRYLGCELNKDYESLQNKRLAQQSLVLE
jgi:DNA modification methylase